MNLRLEVFITYDEEEEEAHHHPTTVSKIVVAH